MPTLEVVTDIRNQLDIIRETLNESWRTCGHKTDRSLCSTALFDLEHIEVERRWYPGRPGPIPDSAVTEEIAQLKRAIAWQLTPVLTRKSKVDPLEHGRACPFPIPPLRRPA